MLSEEGREESWQWAVGRWQFSKFGRLPTANCLLLVQWSLRPKRADPYLAKSARGWKKRPK